MDSYLYPAMTDFEAQYFLDSIKVKLDLEKMYLIVKRKKIKITEEDLGECRTMADNICAVICKLIESKIVKPNDVVKCMESLKVLRFNENEKI